MENNDLYLKVESDFDGMTDCVQQINSPFTKAEVTERSNENTLGVNGIWVVGQSRDGFRKYEDENYKGYNVYNCCGSFIIANKK